VQRIKFILYDFSNLNLIKQQGDLPVQLFYLPCIVLIICCYPFCKYAVRLVIIKLTIYLEVLRPELTESSLQQFLCNLIII
jgi:hypothetical protein